MDWKEFFRFGWVKLGITFLFFMGYIITAFLAVFSIMDVTLNNSVKYIMMGIHYFFDPFFFLSWFGLVPNIIYWYTLSCLIVYLFKNLQLFPRLINYLSNITIRFLSIYKDKDPNAPLWKEALKHAVILCVLLFSSGIINTILRKNMNLLKHNQLLWLWIVSVIALIIIPLLYSLLIKKSVKEVAAIALLFIVLSSAIFLPLKIITSNAIHSYKDGFLLFATDVFTNNPVSLIVSPICLPITLQNIRQNSNELVCVLQKYGSFAEIVFSTIISFIIVYLSMIIGSYLFPVRKNSDF